MKVYIILYLVGGLFSQAEYSLVNDNVEYMAACEIAAKSLLAEDHKIIRIDCIKPEDIKTYKRGEK